MRANLPDPPSKKKSLGKLRKAQFQWCLVSYVNSISFTSQQLEVFSVNSENWLGSYGIVRISMHIIILIEMAMEDYTSAILGVDTFTFHHLVSTGIIVYSKVAGFHHLVLLVDLVGLGAGLVFWHLVAQLHNQLFLDVVTDEGSTA